MKSIVIPTKENTWMLALWVPLIAAMTLIPGRHLALGFSIAISLVEVAIAIWALLRVFTKSSVELDATDVLLLRRNKVIRTVSVQDIERVVLSGGSFSVYGHGKSLPLVMRAIQFREKHEREAYLRAITEWCHRQRIKVQ